MTFLKKIMRLLFEKSENTLKDCLTQSKPTITIGVRPVYTSAASSQAFDVTVVGVHYYQETLQRICDNKHEEGKVVLKQAAVVPENDNPEDANAVRVEIDGETVGHLSRRNASVWRGRAISDKSSGAVRCQAKIVWDRRYVPEGSYMVLLDMNLSLPDSKIEPGSASRAVGSGRPDHIEFLVDELNEFELSHCKVGDIVNFWDTPGKREVFIYRQGTNFGEGKIGVCPDEVRSTICAAPGCDAIIASIYEGGCRIDCRIISKAEMTERMRKAKEEEKAKRARSRSKIGRKPSCGL